MAVYLIAAHPCQFESLIWLTEAHAGMWFSAPVERPDGEEA